MEEIDRLERVLIDLALLFQEAYGEAPDAGRRRRIAGLAKELDRWTVVSPEDITWPVRTRVAYLKYIADQAAHSEEVLREESGFELQQTLEEIGAVSLFLQRQHRLLDLRPRAPKLASYGRSVAAELLTDAYQATNVSVWFGTNRVEVPSAKPAARFRPTADGEDAPLQYGQAIVSVPDRHEEGEVEQPRWWRLELREDAKKHIIVQDVLSVEQEEWCRRAHSRGDEGLLFIHGYNVSFEASLLRTAQLAYDLKFPGPALCFSWASKGRVLQYMSDEDTVTWTASYLADFLTSVRTSLGLSSVHVIAHSMGNRVFAGALQQLATRTVAKEQAPLGRLVLAAADIGVKTFHTIKHHFGTAESLTIYASRADGALVMSAYMHNARRIGDASPPVVIPPFETVDVTAAGKTMFGLGHSYFASSRQVFADLYYLVTKGIRAGERVSVRKKMPEGYFILK